MRSNILITSAAGYMYGSWLGVLLNGWLFHGDGSLVADFLANSNTLIEREQIDAAVKSEEQAKALFKIGHQCAPIRPDRRKSGGGKPATP